MADPNAKHDPRGRFQTSIERREDDAAAARLRSAGLTYRQIAERLGITLATAHNRVQRALAETPVDSVQELRRVESDRLDLAYRAVMRIVLDETVTPRTRVEAVTALVRVSESRRKLFGADAPHEVSVRVSDSMEAEITALAKALGVADPDAPLMIEPPR